MHSSCTQKALFQTIRGHAVKADILYVRTKFCCLRVLFIDPYLSRCPNLTKAGHERSSLLVQLCCDNRIGASRERQVKTKSSTAI